MLFDDNMTWPEAMSVLWKELEGKSKEDQEKILQEYKKYISVATAKELDGSNTLTAY